MSAGASADVSYRGWYKLCVAGWIILGLVTCASVGAILHDVLSTTVSRAESNAAAARKDKRRRRRDAAAAAAAAAADEDGDTSSAAQQRDVSLQSHITELDDRVDQRL